MNRVRTQVDTVWTDEALDLVRKKMVGRLEEKGRGTYASIHEVLGILAEEYYELTVAVKNNDQRNVVEELKDLAVGCLFGIACIEGGFVDW